MDEIFGRTKIASLIDGIDPDDRDEIAVNLAIQLDRPTRPERAIQFQRYEAHSPPVLRIIEAGDGYEGPDRGSPAVVVEARYRSTWGSDGYS